MNGKPSLLLDYIRRDGMKGSEYFKMSLKVYCTV